MMINPFFSMYVGDRLSAGDFVTIFSPFLVKHAMPLFHSGNVVVTGVQGSGKSMLLSLLRPDVRIKYHEMGLDFPVPSDQRKFLSSVVNLAHSNAIDFGYRVHEEGEAEFLFGDFLNYLVVESFLKNIAVYANYKDASIAKEVGLIGLSEKYLSQVAGLVSSLAVWEGWLTQTSDFDSLLRQIEQRNRSYRRYLHRKDKVLDPQISLTRTAIGEPIQKCVEILFSSGLVDPKTNVFIDIDQYEELGNILTGDLDIDYRSIVNRALADRNPIVSYRIGTRGYAWRGHAKIMGTAAKLEEERDYKFVDLDLMLRRFENRSTYIWPDFAEDIFYRRLKFAFPHLSERLKPKILDAVYHKTQTAMQKARSLVRDPTIGFIKPEAELSAKTFEGLRKLASEEPLLAILGEAWIRQKGDSDIEFELPHEQLPWIKNKYWRKERDQIALMQLASRLNAQVPWGGGDEVIELSGGCAAVFLSLNHFIWEAWLQTGSSMPDDSRQLPQIPLNIQSQAILNASGFWVKKVTHETGNSSERFRFLSLVSTVLSRKLVHDMKMSNPGHNGFSLPLNELEESPRVFDFLRELADYGNLVMGEHTTKERHGRPRRKFHFNPVFCPYLGLPRNRTKEPLYTTIKEVSLWLYDAGFKSIVSPQVREYQPELFQ